MRRTALFDVIAFDADDTLWVNEPFYQAVEENFTKLLTAHGETEEISRALFRNEMANMALYGYGAKAFALSMIQTAVEISDGQVQGEQVIQIINWTKAMLAEPKPLMPGVKEVVSGLAKRHTLMLLTKGDLNEQEGKLESSRLKKYFTYIEIVKHKDAQVYRDLLGRYNIPPARFLMIGNSLKSDVLPVVEVGGQAVHIPAQVTWAHEEIEHDGEKAYYELDHIGELPELINQLISGN